MSDSEKPICIPSVLGPMVVCFLFPPAFVFLHEMRKDPPFSNAFNIFVSIILTCFLYFPGLIHSLYTKYHYKCGGILNIGDDV